MAQEPGRAPARALQLWRRRGCRPRTRTPRGPAQRRWRRRCRAACRWPPPVQMPLRQGHPACHAWHCIKERMLGHCILSARTSLTAVATATQALKLMANYVNAAAASDCSSILWSVHSMVSTTTTKLYLNTCAIGNFLCKCYMSSPRPAEPVNCHCILPPLFEAHGVLVKTSFPSKSQGCAL